MLLVWTPDEGCLEEKIRELYKIEQKRGSSKWDLCL